MSGFNKNMTEISFTSSLKPVRIKDFRKITASMSDDGFVDFPWLISSSRVQKDVYTTHICDCSAFLLNDGEKALLKHLNPNNDNNHNIYKIYNFIETHFKLPDKKLQAVLIGSHPEEISQDIFKQFAKFIERFEIPATILKTGKSPTDVAYRTCSDEVLITNEHIDKSLKAGKSKQEALLSGFEYVKIAPCDEIV